MSADEVRAAMKEKSVDTVREKSGESDLVSVQDELRRVDKLYGEALGYARQFIDDVRDGKPFDFQDAAPLVSGFIDSVFRNESAAAAIGRLKAFDEYTYTHCINVSILAVILGKKLGYSPEKLELVGIAGLFHDVGKAVIPESILNKPGKLTEDEMEVMRTHPLRGYGILKAQQNIPVEVLRGTLEHHEKYDGSGYPRGLKGEQISDIARLLAVVDVYDALTSRRVYKEPMPPTKVLALMYKWRVTDFHPNTVELFIKSLGVYPVGSFVRLSSGLHGVVTDLNPLDPLRPKVRVAYDENMQPLEVKDEDLSQGDLSIMDVVNPDDHGIEIYSLIQ
ncbi:HD-GYP domain-containing protein [uncultured Pseudodesulfovibrio sp.]|uniref:HD-GYP domain-containing protein n=1 Tax=uncultured Pseudodesulfovibrio sp. TaxID=2035858 RepID=UPI0029C64428|nr:HD-GYP domain-containing protein [uncultured Pseudodesulfovibrio sp.]